MKKIFSPRTPSDYSAKQRFKGYLLERLGQVLVGLALAAITSGFFAARQSAHEDVGAETETATEVRDFRFNTSKLKDVLVAIGGEGSHLAPRTQMGLTATTPVSTIEARRKANNTTRINKMWAPIRPKIRAIIHDLEGKPEKWRPFVDVGVYRTPAEQLKKYRRGYSKVTWSFHNATNPNGTPGSLAADVADAHWGWDKKTPVLYTLHLASSARAHGLETGIYFGCSAAEKAIQNKAISTKNWKMKVPIGWDAWHIQPQGLNMKKARAGARPKF